MSDEQDDFDAPEAGQSTHRQGPGRRKDDMVFRSLQKYWFLLSFLLTVGISLLVYIHSNDMAQVHELQVGDALMVQQRAVNLQRLAVVEERTQRLEKAIENQDDKLDAILKAVQWQNETRKGSR